MANNIFLATRPSPFCRYDLSVGARRAGGPKISVGAPYFNAVFAPLTIPFLIMLPLGPLLAWRNDSLSPLVTRLAPAALAAILITLGLAMTRNGTPLLALVLLGGAFWLIGGALTDMGQRLRRLQNLTQTPLLSAPVAHAGLGVMIIGIITATAWRQELVVAAAPGDVLQIGEKTLRFDGVRERAGRTTHPSKAGLFISAGRTKATLCCQNAASTKPSAARPPRRPSLQTWPAIFMPLLVNRLITSGWCVFGIIRSWRLSG